MAILSTVNPYRLVHDYQNGSSSRERLVDETLKSLKETLPLDRWLFIQKVAYSFRQSECSSVAALALKQALCQNSERTNWKEALLHAHYERKIDLYYLFIKYINAMERPIRLEERSLQVTQGELSALIGSSFTTNKQARISDQGNHLLDSIFAAICRNEKGQFNGYALAVGDGAGGHFGEKAQDKKIARASHFGTKSFVRLSSVYEDPDHFLRSLPKVIKMIGAEIEQKASCEGTTLIGCRAFLDNRGFRLIGFNIGDTMLIGWHPPTQQLYRLLSSHASEAGTAIIPTAFRSFEVQTLDSLVPNGTLLFLMTDGIHDTLPFKEVEGRYPNGLLYKERILTSEIETLLQNLQGSPPQVYLQTLVKRSVDEVERLRSKADSTPNQLGDDFAILQCELTKPDSLFQRIKGGVSRWLSQNSEDNVR